MRSGYNTDEPRAPIALAHSPGRFWRAVCLASLAVLSTACAGQGPLDGIPLVNVIRAPDGSETVLSGQIQPKMDFSSTFSASDGRGLDCSGSFSSRGAGVMNCTNGWSVPISVPKGLYGQRNGSYLAGSDGIGVAVGWGAEADAARLRGLF